MSTAVSTRKHQRQLITLKEKATLVVSKELLMQVHYLHHRVNRGIEWSGILIYDTVSGNINEPGNWVINAEKCIPMDVGTAGYTEYEITPSDEFGFDQMTDALMGNKKMGHIHTHHTMGTFFSGVDTDELHDNAPKHAYYLSLIVDYNEPDKWMAKVAICGEISQVGTVKSTGLVKTVRSWFANPGESKEEVEDLSKEETIDKKVEVLYIIDCNIEIADEVSAFQKRVTEVTKPKTYAYPRGYTPGVPAVPVRPAGKVYDQKFKEAYPHLFEDDDMDEWENVGAGQRRLSEKSVQAGKPNNRHAEEKNQNAAVGKTYTPDTEEVEVEEGKSPFPNNTFSPGAVKPFLSRWISQDLDSEFELSRAILDLTRCDIADRSLAIDLMEDNLETYAMLHFQGDITYVEMHCIAVAMLDLLEAYRNFMIYDKIIDILDVYVLPESHVSNEEVTRLTGLTFTINCED